MSSTTTTPKRRSSRRSVASDAPEGPPTSKASKAAKPPSTTNTTKKAKSNKSKPAKMGKEILGKRFSMSWPGDRVFYDCRVIAYDAKKKQHMVIYDEDNSIEEVSFSRRKYKKLGPLDEEKEPGSLVGKKILLESSDVDQDEDDGDKNGGAKSKKNAAIVLRSMKVSAGEDDEEDDDMNMKHQEKDKDDAVLHLVVYPSNEYMTTVDLQKHPYTIVDMHTEEKITPNDEEQDVNVNVEVPENDKKVDPKHHNMDTPEGETSASATNPISSNPIAKTTAPALPGSVEAPDTDTPVVNADLADKSSHDPEVAPKVSAASKINTTVAPNPVSVVDKKDSAMVEKPPKNSVMDNAKSTPESVPAPQITATPKAAVTEASAAVAVSEKEKNNSKTTNDADAQEIKLAEKPSETAVAATSIVDKPVDVPAAVPAALPAADPAAVGNTNPTEKEIHIDDDDDDSIMRDPLMDDEPPLADSSNQAPNVPAKPAAPAVAVEKTEKSEKSDANSAPAASNEESKKPPVADDVEMIDANNGDAIAAKNSGDSTSQAVKAAMDATTLLEETGGDEIGDDMPSEGSTIPIPKEGEDVRKSDKAVETPETGATEAMDIEKPKVPAADPVSEAPAKVPESINAAEKPTDTSPLAVKTVKAMDTPTEALPGAQVPPKAPQLTENSKEAASKPLTVENVKALNAPQPGPESSTPENSKETTGAGANAGAVQDEDSKTVSDGENEKWVASSANKLADPKSVEKKFVSINTSKDGKKIERIAYVDSVLSNGSCFIQFHDTEGGNMHITLTTENCRVLTQPEVEALGPKKEEGQMDVDMDTANGNADGPGSGTKRKMANGNGNGNSSNKRQRAADPATAVKVEPTKPQASMDASLIGKCITVMWPGNGGRYKCLVIGCHTKDGVTKHRVFYVEDESTETIELAKRSWNMVKTEDMPWNSTGLVGKRLYIFWEGEFTDNDAQKKAEEMFGKENAKVPYEVFVVKFLGPNKYRLLYTIDDNLEDRVLNNDDKGWNVLEDGVKEVDGLPIISWVDAEENEENE